MKRFTRPRLRSAPGMASAGGILLAALPVLMVYGHNAAQLHPQQLLRPLVVVVAVVAVLQAVLFLWWRQAMLAALVAGGIALALQLFGHAVGVLQRLGLASGVAAWMVAAFLAVLVVGVLVWAWRARQQPRAVRHFGVRVLAVALVLGVVQVGRIGWAELRAPATPGSVEAAAPPTAVAASGPDIYFILLDGYGRSDVLQQLYGVDNSDFLQRLEAWGFHVADSSHANYIGTLWSLASILNMDYLHELVVADPSTSSSNALIRLVRSNLVVHALRQRGYEIVSLAGGYGVAEFSNPDVYLSMAGARDDFEQMLLQTTPLPWILPRHADAHALHRQRLRWVFDTIPRVPISGRPQFVFAHVLAPHPPFVFDAAGAIPARRSTFTLNDGSDWYVLGGSPEEYRRLYAGQARWVTRRVQESLEALLRQRPDDPPVILLLSDHGPGAELDWNSVDDTNLRERFGNLCAVHLPRSSRVPLPEDLSAAAAFRLVFDACFGTAAGPLPPRSWFCPKGRPFDLQEVTSRLSPPAPR